MANPAAYTDESITTGTSRGSFDYGLQDQYLDALSKWVQVGTPLAATVSKTRGQMSGKKTVTSVTTLLNQSAGVARGERHQLPPPSPTEGVNPAIIARKHVLRIQFTGEVERSARSGNKAAWYAARGHELECAREQFNLNFAFNLCDGPFQQKATVASHTTGSVQGATRSIITLAGENDHVATVAGFNKFGAFYLRRNERIAFVKAASAAGAHTPVHTLATVNQTYILVTPDDSDVTAPTITTDQDLTGDLAGSTDPAVGDWVVPYASRKESASTTALQLSGDSFYGINGIGNVSQGTTRYSAIYGLDKTDADGLESLYFTGLSAGVPEDFTDRKVELAMSRSVRRAGSRGVTKKICTSYSLIREVAGENRSNRRFQPVIEKSGYGYLSVQFGDMMAPYVPDWYMPPIFVGINPEMWGWHERFKLQTLPGINGERFVPDYDASEVVMVKEGNIFMEAPWTSWCVDDVAYDEFNPRA